MPHHETPDRYDRCRVDASYRSRALGDVEMTQRLTMGQCDLALHFLRRYVTWCVRSRRFGAAAGAQTLHQRVAVVARFELDEQPSPS